LESARGTIGHPGREPWAILFGPFRAGWRIVQVELTSILSCSGHGTGVDHGGGEGSPGGQGNHARSLMALSSLGVSTSIRFQGVPATPSTGYKTAHKDETFFGLIVSDRLILSHPDRVIWQMRRMSPLWAPHVDEGLPRRGPLLATGGFHPPYPTPGGSPRAGGGTLAFP
jgi:hypothetical protein